MKFLIKSSIVTAFFMGGALFSCKNNQDGYSDQIETLQVPADTAKMSVDSSATNESMETSSTGAANTGSESKTGTAGSTQDGNVPSSTATGSTATGSAGTGSGPGESVKDGATYTNTSENKKDSKEVKNKKATSSKKE